MKSHGTVVTKGSIDDITYTLDTYGDDGWFVNAESGEILGKASKAGRQRLTLYAMDAGGSLAVVEQIIIDVKQPLKFLLKRNQPEPADVTWADVGFGAVKGSEKIAGEDGLVQYAVGSTIKFPAMSMASFELFENPAMDDFDGVAYKRRIVDSQTGEESTPGLWLVDTGTGEMLAQPEQAGMYTAALAATDRLGESVDVRTWQFEVLLKDTDVPGNAPNNLPCVNGVAVDNSSTFDNVFTCDCEGGFRGDNCEIAIECVGGEALVDGECEAFVLSINADKLRTANDETIYTDPAAMTLDNSAYYTVRESYRFAPLAIDDANTTYTKGNKADMSYAMAGDTDGFFLNTKNGEMLGTFANFDNAKNVTQNYSITLTVRDAGGAEQVLETMAFEVRYPDLEVDDYGPNGKGCDNGGIRVDNVNATAVYAYQAVGDDEVTFDPGDVIEYIDEIEEGSWMGSVNGKRGTFPSNLVEKVDGTGGKYDLSYDCRCTGLGLTTYSGKNCEIETTSAVASAAGGGNILVVGGGVAGGFVFILLVVGLIYKHHIHQVKMRAFDFAAELSMLMENGTIDKSENALGVPREVKRSNITMVKAIGQGAFGEVRFDLRNVISPTCCGRLFVETRQT